MGPTIAFLILVCQFEICIQACSDCNCCNDGERACDTNKNCINGCRDGYYGKKCIDECSNNCKTCDSKFSCTECKQGFYSSPCNMVCGRGCVNNTCSQTTGRCTCKSTDFREDYCNSCSDNKYGEECNNTCPSNCDSCSSAASCSFCKNALFYGSYCQYRCSNGCIDGLCNKANGRCRRGCKHGFKSDQCDTCIPGLYGSYCNNTCQDGTYGEQCLKLCRNADKYCQVCVSNERGEYKNCTKCNTGYMLVIATKQNQSSCHKCPDFCKDNICNAAGLCTNGCLKGKWGEKCSNHCKTNCEECSQRDGNCSKYSGQESVQENSPDHGNHSTSTLIGAIFGAGLIGIVFGVAIMFALMIWRRRINITKQTEVGSENFSAPNEDNTHDIATKSVIPVTYETLKSRDERMYSQVTSSQQEIQSAVPTTYETLRSRDDRVYSQITSSQQALPLAVEYDYSAY